MKANKEVALDSRRQLVLLLQVNNELTSMGSLDDLCRRAVELGRDRLGFDRLSIWFRSQEDPQKIVGSFGTDERGSIRDERGKKVFVNKPDTAEKILNLRVPGVICREGNLYNHEGKIVGQGTWACAAMGRGEEIIGYLITDNLLDKHPITEPECELLGFYASMLGHLCSRIRTEEALRESVELYESLIKNLPDAVIVTDLKERITYISRHALRLYGYKKEGGLMGRSIFEFISPEVRKEAEKTFRETLKKGFVTGREYELLKKDGSKFVGELSISLLRDSKGEPTAFISSIRDITAHKQIEEKLRRAEQEKALVLDNMSELVTFQDLEHRVIWANKAAGESVNQQPQQLIGRYCYEIWYHRNVPCVICPVAEARDSGEFREGEVSTPDGRIWLVRGYPVRNTKGEVEGVVEVTLDITERKRAEETVRRLAYHDHLTGLPNRMLFNNRLLLEISRAERHQRIFAVMLLDLDHFKDINDTLGHSVGDYLLQSVGKRLTDILRKSDTVSRMGGDEFVLLLPEISRVKDVEKIAAKILSGIRKPFEIDNRKLRITTSIGIAIYPEDGKDAETLVRNADIAMYWAKEVGRNNYQRYTISINEDFWEKRRVNREDFRKHEIS